MKDRNRRHHVESLEGRRMLASYQPGDANLDFYVDEADLVQVFKVGGYNRDQVVGWAGGDWDRGGWDSSLGRENPSAGDQRFDASDLVAVFINNRYLRGPYASDATRPSHERQPLVGSSVNGTSATLWVNSKTGDLTLESAELLNAIHITSRSGSFAEKSSGEKLAIFDVASANSQFRLAPTGFNRIRLGRLDHGFDTGNAAQLLRDLRVDGAKFAGGDVGTVRLAYCDDCGVDVDRDASPPVAARARPLVTDSTTSGLTLQFNPSSSSLVLHSSQPLRVLEVNSRSGLLSSTAPTDLKGPYDVSTQYKRFFVHESGVTDLNLGNLASSATTAADLLADLTFQGWHVNGDATDEVVLTLCEDCHADDVQTATFASLIYDFSSGGMRLIAENQITEFELTSRSSSFTGARPTAFDGAFDSATTDRLYLRERTGIATVHLGLAGPKGWTEQQLRNDLTFAATQVDDQPVEKLQIVVCDGCLFFPDAQQPDRFQSGDANFDFFFDEADVIQAFKSGKFETGERANWNEGDWAGSGQGELSDGLFTTEDLVAAFQVGAYRQGGYQPVAAQAINLRQPLVMNTKSNVRVVYSPVDGTIRIEGSETLLSTFHLFSKEGFFSANVSAASPFDVSTENSLFVVAAEGRSGWTFAEAIQPGLTMEQLAADLSIDGSQLAGGGLGTVSLECDDCQTDFARTRMPGDFTLDGEVDQRDIDMLCAQVHGGSDLLFYDLNGDDQVDADDLDALIHDVLRTTYGDSNLDGRFDSGDLVKIFASRNGQSGDQLDGGWATGDWNCDGEFNSQDLILAFQDGNYIR